MANLTDVCAYARGYDDDEEEDEDEDLISDAHHHPLPTSIPYCQVVMVQCSTFKVQQVYWHHVQLEGR